MHLPLKPLQKSKLFFQSISVLAALLASPNLYAQNLSETKVSSQHSSSDIYVQVQSAKIRQAPKPWANGVADVKFGDKLTELGVQDSWLKVKDAKSAEGFLHSTAVTARKIVLSASKEDLLNSSVDAPDVYLAGKGFNNEVLKELAVKEPTYNFAAVDEMQKGANIDSARLLSFIKAGQLNEGHE